MNVLRCGDVQLHGGDDVHVHVNVCVYARANGDDVQSLFVYVCASDRVAQSLCGHVHVNDFRAHLSASCPHVSS